MQGRARGSYPGAHPLVRGSVHHVGFFLRQAVVVPLCKTHMKARRLGAWRISLDVPETLPIVGCASNEAEG